jgi:Transglycosylase SLT domain
MARTATTARRRLALTVVAVMATGSLAGLGCSGEPGVPSAAAPAVPAGPTGASPSTESATESAGPETASSASPDAVDGMSESDVAGPPGADGTGAAAAGGSATPGPYDLLARQLPDTVPDGPALGQLITAVETAIRDPATTSVDLAAWGALQQRSYRVLREHPEWLEDAVAQAPAGLIRDAVQRNALAGARISAATPTPTTTETDATTESGTGLPDWTIVTPEPPDELLAMYHEAAERFGIPWGYLAAINLIETRMGRIEGLSTAGAQGPMQFLPSTWAEYGLGGDITDPRDAIHAAANYLAASGGPADMERAIFAYNRSRAYVLAVTMYAQNMLDDERAFLGYWHWQVYYRSADGDVLLPEGWSGP